MKTLMAYPLPVCTGPNVPEWCATRNMSTDCFSRVPQKNKDRRVGFFQSDWKPFLKQDPETQKFCCWGRPNLRKTLRNVFDTRASNNVAARLSSVHATASVSRAQCRCETVHSCGSSPCVVGNKVHAWNVWS